MLSPLDCFYNLFMFCLRGRRWWWFFNCRWALPDLTANVLLQVKQPTVTSNVMRWHNGLLNSLAEMMASRGVVVVGWALSGPVTVQLRHMTIIHWLLLMMRSPFLIHDWNCHLTTWKVSTQAQVNWFDLTHCCVNISYPTLISLSLVLSWSSL